MPLDPRPPVIDRLPAEGTTDARQIARTVNRLAEGKIDCVGEVELPSTAGAVEVDDARVSELSCILVQQFWWIDTGDAVPILPGVGRVTFAVTSGPTGRVLTYAVIG